jgi:phosphatidylglycerol:prolipoprotein diacylglycerol transferase
VSFVNVYPLTIQLGPLTITGFGIMVMSGFFMAGWSMQQRLREQALNDQYAWDIVVAAVIGGLVGAKLWYVGLYGVDRLFERAGLVWYGGLAGGALAVILNGWRLKVPVRFTVDLAAPGLAVGYALGRIGCFLVQDDYGIPTSLPWGMRFPEGLPATTARNLSAWGIEVPAGVDPFEVIAVHPTQLYETAVMLFVFWLLWRWRANSRGTGWLFGVYLMMAGTERFLVEFIRAKDDRFLGSFTLAQAASATVVLISVFVVTHFAKRTKIVPEKIPVLALPSGEKGGKRG